MSCEENTLELWANLESYALTQVNVFCLGISTGREIRQTQYDTFTEYFLISSYYSC